jgi:hypothetical protein
MDLFRGHLLEIIIGVALILVVYITVVGGIVCVRDDDYTFSQYVAELGGVYRLLGTAAVAAIAKGVLEQHARNGKQ